MVNQLKYSRYAVLGSNSFAASVFIAKAIEQGRQVIGFNRSSESDSIFLQYRNLSHAHCYKFIQSDINCDLDHIMLELDKFCPEVIVDFAGQGMVAESWQAPEQWFNTNVVSKVRLHDQLRLRKWLKKYVRVSTPEVYGSHSNLLKETWLYNPTTPYAVSHAAIDMSLKAFYHQYGFPVVFSRFANFYGPGQQLYRIVPRTIIYALLGKKLQLHGGGSSVRAFIYGEDVADAVFRLAELGRIGEVYHFSPEKFYTIRQVVEIVYQRLGFKFSDMTEVTIDRPGKDRAYLMSSVHAREELGWRDHISLEDGIDKTICWVKENLQVIRQLPLDYIHKI